MISPEKLSFTSPKGSCLGYCINWKLSTARYSCQSFPVLHIITLLMLCFSHSRGNIRATTSLFLCVHLIRVCRYEEFPQCAQFHAFPVSFLFFLLVVCLSHNRGTGSLPHFPFCAFIGRGGVPIDCNTLLSLREMNRNLV